MKFLEFIKKTVVETLHEEKKQGRLLIQERLAEVDDDVDLIYDLYFKKDIEYVKNTGHINDDLFEEYFTDTSILKTPLCVEAHEKNPCKIFVNNKERARKSPNHYNPLENEICVSIHQRLKNLIIHDFNGDMSVAADYIDNRIYKEFDEDKIKGSIHHELAHWIDDTLNKRHIKKRIEKQIKKQTVNLNNIPVNMTKMEIQGQIHNIKQLYRKYKENWDELTFNDLKNLSPTLNVIYNNLNHNQRIEWLKTLKKRMYRENLLGKKMIGNF
jgi:hypothetical protein